MIPAFRYIKIVLTIQFLLFFYSPLFPANKIRFCLFFWIALLGWFFAHLFQV